MNQFGWESTSDTPKQTMSNAIQLNLRSTNPLFRRAGRGEFLLADDGGS